MKCYGAHYQMINSHITDNYFNGQHLNGNGNIEEKKIIYIVCSSHARA